ncbi:MULTISPECIES: hypothetical protein [Cyanophyceae]|uniref:hypothetical protein n=1 Tax=Cyanophyceae TaxID=3028117 RepID=UPI0016877C17|nr:MULTISPECIES: hypothetical protein [Cyanophyceae]MBD1917636.1 hypothetical protein [Phormidium sp. FACHB-77]MBD2031183.1 hypothetical protein [Phormidium sp. FACHB-322]MBD2050749.1 hypothetical protein [Leptolyngbya sp. FACHB-60]
MLPFLRLRSSVALSLGAAVLTLAFSCQPVPSADHSSAMDKIAFDLSTLDENGLHGPTDSKRSLDYEFCIPAGGAYTQVVSAIDPSAQFFPQSRGRIGCGEGEVLTIGNTHQANHQTILIELANLNYIDRIQPVDWE